jgi:hypothetical protein
VRWRHNRSQELDGEVRQTEAGTLSVLRQAFKKKLFFKGTGSPDEYFLKAYKIAFVLSVHALLVIKLLGCLVEEKNKYKDFACFYENPY